jgi:hypothetical protein
MGGTSETADVSVKSVRLDTHREGTRAAMWALPRSAAQRSDAKCVSPLPVRQGAAPVAGTPRAGDQ